MTEINLINTIYIISKGRPHCITAQTLKKINYPGQWFIVCGNNDETIPEYIKNWGKEKILIFDWFTEVKNSNLLDNFGIEKMSSGAVPVRNATRAISEKRNELRHWQFDDDYIGFYKINPKTFKWIKLQGEYFETELYKLANFGYKANLINIGFNMANESRNDSIFQITKRVFNAHNMSSFKDSFLEWKGRMNDDLINAIETKHKGLYEMSLKYLCLMMKPTQQDIGGNTDIYQAHGTVRKTSYAILFEPNATKLIQKFGRFHHRVNWPKISPKLLHQKWSKLYDSIKI